MSDGYPFNWVYFKSSELLGDVFNPMVDIDVKTKSGEWKRFAAEIDSGSPISLFNSSDCERLGYNLTDGKCIYIKGVLGCGRKAYIHNIDVKIRKDIIKARIAFTVGELHKQLVGTIDVFESFSINMRRKICKTYFTREL